MLDTDWEAIREAVDFVLRGSAARVDGRVWKVYRMGNVIRIDIEGTIEGVDDR